MGLWHPWPPEVLPRARVPGTWAMPYPGRPSTSSQRRTAQANQQGKDRGQGWGGRTESGAGHPPLAPELGQAPPHVVHCHLEELIGQLCWPGLEQVLQIRVAHHRVPVQGLGQRASANAGLLGLLAPRLEQPRTLSLPTLPSPSAHRARAGPGTGDKPQTSSPHLSTWTAPPAGPGPASLAQARLGTGTTRDTWGVGEGSSGSPLHTACFSGEPQDWGPLWSNTRSWPRQGLYRGEGQGQHQIRVLAKTPAAAPAALSATAQGQADSTSPSTGERANPPSAHPGDKGRDRVTPNWHQRQ